VTGAKTNTASKPISNVTLPPSSYRAPRISKALACLRCSEGLDTRAISLVGNCLEGRAAVKKLPGVLLGFRVYRNEYGLT
jgi:hypothetical protein